MDIIIFYPTTFSKFSEKTVDKRGERRYNGTHAETTVTLTKEHPVQVEDLVSQVIADNIDDIVHNSDVDIDDAITVAICDHVEAQVQDKIDESLNDVLGDWLYDNVEIDDEKIKSAIDSKIERLVEARLEKLEDRYRMLGKSVISLTHECIEYQSDISDLKSKVYRLERRINRTWWEWLSDNW